MNNGVQLLVSLGIPADALVETSSWIALDEVAAYQKFLSTPLNRIVSQNVPSLLPQAESGMIKGVLVLEVLSYRDISKPLPPLRAPELANEDAEPTTNSFQSNNRTLKILFTNGVQQFVGFEYEFCPVFELIRIGMKVQLRDVFYKHQMLLLSPRCLDSLGVPSILWTLEEDIHLL